MANDFYPLLARGLKRAGLKMSRLFHVSLGESLTSTSKIIPKKMYLHFFLDIHFWNVCVSDFCDF